MSDKTSRNIDHKTNTRYCDEMWDIAHLFEYFEQSPILDRALLDTEYQKVIERAMTLTAVYILIRPNELRSLKTDKGNFTRTTVGIVVYMTIKTT
jgi:CMP-N-acetylneuraminic acid synthetase